MLIGLIAPPFFSVPPAAYGPVESVVDVLATSLAGLGHSVLLAATRDSTCPVENVGLYEVAQTGRAGEAIPELAHVVHAYGSLAHCDVIHDHTVIGPWVNQVINRGGRRIIATVHSPFNEEIELLLRPITESALIVPISGAHAQSTSLRCSAPVPHGIDLEKFREGRGEGGYALFLGRMSPDKGVVKAIDAAQRAGMRLLIAARCSHRTEIGYFNEHVRPRLGHDVEFVGEASFTEKIKLLQSAMCLVNPITWDEPFGLVMAEALACGTPVIAAARGAASEMVIHGTTGYLCRSDDMLPEYISRAISLSRRACRLDAERRFCSRLMAARYVGLYKQVLMTL